MEKNLFREVYKQVCGLALKDCPPSSLSGLLHGYLSVYSMVRVYPWLEDEYGSLWDIHDRIREIARVLQELLKDKDIPVDTRAGYAVDLMDAYLLYSDIKFLDVALDTAYEILIPKGSDKMVLPCRTPNICRLLCNCYYYTGETESGYLAGDLVIEVIGVLKEIDRKKLLAWWKAICLYNDVVGIVTSSSREWGYRKEDCNRLYVDIEQVEDERVEFFQQMRRDCGICLVVEVFDILARREFMMYNEGCNI
ncbi:hypothetical protein [Butyricimonas paravirosa]|uniref:hypothetical protein n=1 Tax=Butyricimonas paravirosa TaxID=1472417 RepID=UPI0022E49082|nr:hypothetical protein [Butyricimonas paravirosa]